jgi:WD40 repeat protein
LGALGDGALVVVPSSDTGAPPRLIAGHQGVSLEIAADADDHAFLSGGDDGRLLLVDPQIDVPTLLAEHAGKWIDHVASSSEGLRAYAIGKMLYRLDDAAQEYAPPLTLPSSIGGLAFSPDGQLLAISHYGGVSVLSCKKPLKAPTLLPWKGSHLSLLWSPDGQFLLSSMQDGAVHGWLFQGGVPSPEEGREMHMQGYETKIASMRFTTGGKYLATSGAAQVVCWPFGGEGPWDKSPLMLGGAEARLVGHVAPHPVDPVVAAGYDDGMVILAPLDGRMEIMIHPPVAARGAGVVGMVWSGEGDGLVVGLENGHLLLFTHSSIAGFVRGRFGG